MSRPLRSCPPDATAALFVEGGDDERMIQRLLPNTPVFFQVFDGRATTQVHNRAVAARRDPGWHRIRQVAVILDAEEDPADSFRLAQSVFDALGWTRPTTPGLIESADDRRFGATLVPGPTRTGGSESLLLDTATPAERACIDAFFACTPNPGSTQAQQDKARALVLAASRSAKGRPDQLWSTVDPAHPALSALRAFLKDLLPPAPEP